MAAVAQEEVARVTVMIPLFPTAAYKTLLPNHVSVSFFSGCRTEYQTGLKTLTSKCGMNNPLPQPMQPKAP